MSFLPKDRIEQLVKNQAGEVNVIKVKNVWGTVSTIELDTNQISWIKHYRKLIVTERDGGFYYRRHQVIPPRISRPIEIWTIVTGKQVSQSRYRDGKPFPSHDIVTGETVSQSRGVSQSRSVSQSR